jgi:signal peptidase I
MSASPRPQITVSVMELCILKKRGLFLSPILAAFIAAKVWPTLLLYYLPALLVAVGYRTIRIPGHKFKVFGASFGVALFSYISLRLFLLDVRYVDGEGMSPEIDNGSRVLVDKTAYWWGRSPIRGDVIISKLNTLQDLTTGVIHVMDRNDVKISRIYRMPGALVEVKDGNRYVNVQVGDSSKTCIPYDTKHPNETPQPLNLFSRGQNPLARGVQSECYFLFRDDHPTSDRYEHWAVPQKSIVGKVTAVLWPPERLKQIPNQKVNDQ